MADKIMENGDETLMDGLTATADQTRSTEATTLPGRGVFKSPLTKSVPKDVHWFVKLGLEKKEQEKKKKLRRNKLKEKQWRKETQRPRQAAIAQTFTEEEQIDYRELQLREKYAAKINRNQEHIIRLAQRLRNAVELSHDEYRAAIYYWGSESSKDLQLYCMAYFDDDFDPTEEEYPLLTEEELLAWVKGNWAEVSRAADAANKLEFERGMASKAADLAKSAT